MKTDSTELHGNGWDAGTDYGPICNRLAENTEKRVGGAGNRNRVPLPPESVSNAALPVGNAPQNGSAEYPAECPSITPNNARSGTDSRTGRSRTSGLPPTTEWLREQTRPEPNTLVPGDCWTWQGQVADGYGRVSVIGRACAAHRVMYELARGAVPTWLTIDHLCRNRACINPDHLEPVTQVENIRRGMAPSAVASRTGRCPFGHELTPIGGRARCKTCQAVRQREWYDRKCAANGKTARHRRSA